MEDKYEQDKRGNLSSPSSEGEIKVQRWKSSRGRKTNTDSSDTSFMQIKMPALDLEGFSLAISFSYYHRKASKRESSGTEGA